MLLENDKIKLRALEPTDLELLYEWENDTKIWGVSSTLIPYSKYILHQYIENSHKDLYESKQLRLIIEAKSINHPYPIGTIDLFDVDFHNKRAGIGILVAKEEHRKKGYASATLKVIEEYCKNHLGLNQLHCQIDKDNEASLKLFEQIGYKLAGELKQWKKTKDGWKSVCFFQHVL